MLFNIIASLPVAQMIVDQLAPQTVNIPCSARQRLVRTDINALCTALRASAFRHFASVYKGRIDKYCRKPHPRPVSFRNENIIFSNPAQTGIYRRIFKRKDRL